MVKEKIEELSEAGALPLYFAALISADALITVERCETYERDLLETVKELPKTNLPKEEIEKWIKIGNDGLEIIRRDRETLLQYMTY